MESTRKAALTKGATQYFTGKPCKHGHVSARRTVTGECIACRAEALAAWRAKNPQKVQAHNKTQYTKFFDKIKNAVGKYRAMHVDELNAKKRVYQKNNLHMYAKIKAKRKAAQLQRTPRWLTDDDHWLIEQAYELAALRTRMFGFVWHVDHLYPLQGKVVSGLHVPTNLQVIPGAENRRKSNNFVVT